MMELPTSAGPVLEMSPDGQSFLYPQTDMIGTDRMLVENFQ